MARVIKSDNEVFNNFRRKLEDLVTIGINSGKVVKPMRSAAYYCPIGCHPLASSKNPYPGTAAGLFSIPIHCAESFMKGFDQGEDLGDEYSQLGLLYRERFYP